MAVNNNLTDFLTNLADGLRLKTGQTGKIHPQDFRMLIDSLGSGGLNKIVLTVRNTGKVLDLVRASASTLFREDAFAEYTSNVIGEITGVVPHIGVFSHEIEVDKLVFTSSVVGENQGPAPSDDTTTEGTETVTEGSDTTTGESDTTTEGSDTTTEGTETGVVTDKTDSTESTETTI